MCRNLIFMIMLATVSTGASAAWTIVTYPGTDNNSSTSVAHTENGDGYSLEIYRDRNNAIRARFIMNTEVRLDGKTCPTFQVDERPAQNRSINEAHCLTQTKWSEYVLGYISADKVTSTAMHNLMNGNQVTYRFIRREAGYGETSFSLAGSKRVLLEVLGKNLEVTTETNPS